MTVVDSVKRQLSPVASAVPVDTPAKRAREDLTDPTSEPNSPSTRAKLVKPGRGGRASDKKGKGRTPQMANRSWGGRDSGARDGKMREWGPKDGESATTEGDKKERLPKKKVAVLIGYNGIGYCGSQMNPGVETIEGTIFKAMVQAGAISADNSDSPQKVGLARAARTDAGVHAAINVVSLKLILAPTSLAPDTTLEEHINSFLPKTIRLWSILRVQGAFNPRSLCDQRQYEYTLPTHLFLGPKPGSPMAKWLDSTRTASAALKLSLASAPDAGPAVPDTPFELSSAEVIAASAAFWQTVEQPSTFTIDVAAKKGFRLSPALLEHARDFVRAYEGSHNFCNFTVGKDFRDRSNQRVMKKLEIGEPFIEAGTEYVSIRFLGQSFMLHQIRKMIGLTILCVRSCTPPSIIAETFGPSRIHIPKAPGLGLLLDEPQFFEYNKRVGESNVKLDLLIEAGRLDDASLKEQLRDVVGVNIPGREATKVQVEAFKKEHIYKRMWEVEQAENVFTKWLNFLDMYAGADFEYLNSKGIIPPASIFKKGENLERKRLPEGAAPLEVEDDAPQSDEEAAGDDG